MELKVNALEFRGRRNFFQGLDVSQSQSVTQYILHACHIASIMYQSQSTGVGV